MDSKTNSLELTFQTPQLPHFPNQLNLSSQDYLAQLCHKGLEKRLNNLLTQMQFHNIKNV